MEKIIPFLWFDHQAEEAANFYTSLFKNSKVLAVRRCRAEAPEGKGNLLSVSFQLEGREFIAFNGGPHFTFSPAISLFVDCKTQAEVDELWTRLSAGGQIQRCGWLQDKFGLSWQIIPRILGDLLQDPDPEKSQKAMQAMLQMDKIDIDGLRASVGV